MGQIVPFTRKPFDPETLALATSAYERAVEELNAPWSVWEIIAKNIIRLIAEGERDPNVLYERALGFSDIRPKAKLCRRRLMPNSRDYRKEAAEQIRRARAISNPDRRRERLMMAQGLKTLAAAEEWLEGLPQKKSAPRNARRALSLVNPTK